MERHIFSPREVRRGCDEREARGGADEMVATGAGTLWRGEGRQRLVVCVLVKEGQFKGKRGIL